MAAPFVEHHRNLVRITENPSTDAICSIGNLANLGSESSIPLAGALNPCRLVRTAKVSVHHGIFSGRIDSNDLASVETVISTDNLTPTQNTRSRQSRCRDRVDKPGNSTIARNPDNHEPRMERRQRGITRRLQHIDRSRRRTHPRRSARTDRPELPIRRNAGSIP